jgi:hypothetical protein
LQQFADSAAASTYTNDSHADWTSAGYGVPQWEIDTIEYIPEIDD